VVVAVVDPEVPVMVTVAVPDRGRAAGRQRQHAGCWRMIGAERMQSLRWAGRLRPSYAAGESAYVRHRDGVSTGLAPCATTERPPKV
jgi:hypothetical protein